MNQPKVFLLELQLKTQGTFKGGNTVGLRKGWMQVLHFSLGVSPPPGNAGASGAGRRTHNPITIVKEVDKASPQMWSALCANDGFQSASLSFPRPNSDGKLKLYHTIDLTNASVVGYKTYHGTAKGKYTLQEELTLSYEDSFVNGARNPALLQMLAGLSLLNFRKKG